MQRTSGDVPDEVTRYQHNWVIADAVLPVILGGICRTIIVTSPSPKLTDLSRHKKYGYEERCFPPWDLEELQTVFTKVYDKQGRNYTTTSAKN